MTEFATIKIQRFRTEDGQPTCANIYKNACDFHDDKGGQRYYCAAIHKEYFIGYDDKDKPLRPLPGCPVWEEAKK